MKDIKHYKINFLKFFLFVIVFTGAAFIAFKVNGNPQEITGTYRLQIADSTAFEELGEALFSDNRFSSPEGRLSGLKKDEFSQFRVSCKSCHLVDEKLKEKGMRGYTDFSARTPVPFRTGDKDPLQFTNRRTQQMINVAGNSIGASTVYHWDGEFNTGNEHTSLIKLIKATFVSRNMGWRPGEENTANTLRLRYILQDDVFAAANSEEKQPSYIDRYCASLGITKEEFFKLDGNEILSICNEAIALYIENIKSDIESPFDLFLTENGVTDPKIADENTLNEFLMKKSFKFINKTVPVLNSEITNSRKVKFGKKELEGLRLFMNRNKTNCSSCHTPPSFTNNKFYNIGVSEMDYKDVHGKFPGDFYSSVKIQKDLSSGNLNVLRSMYQVYPGRNNPEAIDLGHGLFEHTPENYAAFRTPTIRNLKYSNPYLHSGRAETIYNAIKHHIIAFESKTYIKFISPELKEIDLTSEEIENLSAFINALNDHYE
jgi:cytochrome c peroxidase